MSMRRRRWPRHVLGRVVGGRSRAARGEADEPGAGRDHRERPAGKLRKTARGVQGGVAVVQAGVDLAGRRQAQLGRQFGPHRTEHISSSARSGPSRSAQPREIARSEKRRSAGRQRSLWQPRLVTSLARTPLSSYCLRYCGWTAAPFAARWPDPGNSHARASGTGRRGRVRPPAAAKASAANGSAQGVGGVGDVGRDRPAVRNRARRRSRRRAAAPPPRRGRSDRWRGSHAQRRILQRAFSANRRCLRHRAAGGYRAGRGWRSRSGAEARPPSTRGSACCAVCTDVDDGDRLVQQPIPMIGSGAEFSARRDCFRQRQVIERQGSVPGGVSWTAQAASIPHFAAGAADRAVDGVGSGGQVRQSGAGLPLPVAGRRLGGDQLRGRQHLGQAGGARSDHRRADQGALGQGLRRRPQARSPCRAGSPVDHRDWKCCGR